MPANPVVGRETQLAGLLADLDAALAGQGRLVVLSGPAGIGKTALAQQLAAGAAARGTPVTRGRCLDDEGAPPLWPWTQIVARAGGDLGPVHAEAGSGDDSAAARFLLVDHLVQHLIGSAAATGRVVILEDVHWADEASLQALRHCAAELDPSRLLVVVAARHPWPDALAASLDDVLRRPGCRLVDLPHLDAGSVADYLRAVSVQPIDAALAAEVHLRTGGSPLLMAAAAQVIAGRSGQDTAEELWARVCAATDVSRLAQGMLIGLSPAARETVELAAVLAERVDPDLLTGISGVPAADVGPQLRAAARAGLLTADPGDAGYRFAHALVRDAIVTALDPVRRRDLHLAAARQLAERSATDPAYAAVRAGHLLRAGSSIEAQRELPAAAAAAARESDRRLGYEDAARWWGVAVGAAQRSGTSDAELGSLLVELARAEYRSGQYGESLRHCERAATIALRLRRGDLLAEAAVVIQGLGMPGSIEMIHAWCIEARELLAEATRAGQPGDDRLLARLLAQLAWAQAELGERLAAEQTSARALELATATGDPGALLAAVHARSAARWQADGVAEQLSLGRTAVSVGTAAGRPISAVLGHVWRCNSAYQLGNLEAARVEIDAVGRIAEGTRLPLARWHHLRMLASRAAMEGRFEEGLSWSDQAYDLMSESGDLSTMGMSAAYRQFLGIVAGRPDMFADPRLDALFAKVPPMPIMVAAGAATLLLRGQLDEAAATYAAVRPLIFDPPQDPRWLGTIAYLIELVEALDDTEAARCLFTDLESWGSLPGALGVTTVIFRGALTRDLGRMAAVAGDLARAEGLLRDAVEANIRMGARPFVVNARIELASVLRRHDGSDEEIVELARRAAHEGRRLGMTGKVTIAEDLLARHEQTIRQARRRADPLTAREHEIAALVARAMSNREIAAELVLSERTVESHVRSILSKLGFSRRTEIATWALSTH